MSNKTKISKRFVSLIASLVLASSAGLAAWASNAPYESRLTVTFTSSETGSGSGRTVTYTATVVDSAAELTTANPTGSQVRVMGIVIFMCASQQPVSSVGHTMPAGCTFFSGTSSTNSGTVSTRTYSRSYSGADFDNNIANYPFITPTIHFEDASSNRLGIHGNASGNSTPQSSVTKPVPSKYEGPEILAVDTFRPIVAGGKLTFTGKNLSAVTSATIGAKPASLSFDAATGLSIGTPAGLAPGKYDLIMESSYGKLTHINAVTIKAPTPTVTIGFRSDDAYLDEQQVLDLVAFNQKLNSDYEKVRCIVNSADPKVAKRIADLVCAHVARGEARNVEVIKELRDTYPGEGFWVRVYAAG